MDCMKTAFRLLSGLLMAELLGPGMGWAQEQPAATQEVQLDASRDYLIGASMASSQDLLGGDGRKLSGRPLWAFRWGRFRFATGGAAALLSLGRETVDAGVSISLLQDDRWSLSGSLNCDGGRDSDVPLLYGLPEVRSTLRGRVNLGYRITPPLVAGVDGLARFTGA